MEYLYKTDAKTKNLGRDVKVDDVIRNTKSKVKKVLTKLKSS